MVINCYLSIIVSGWMHSFQIIIVVVLVALEYLNEWMSVVGSGGHIARQFVSFIDYNKSVFFSCSSGS